MKKFILAMILITALLLSFAGCSSGTPDASASPSASASASASASDTSKTVTVRGSDYIASLIDELAQTYMTNNPGITIDTQSASSNVGIAMCADGKADIGLSSRELKDIEKATFTNMNQKLLCVDGIAIAVGKDSKVSNLTIEQIKYIFTGVINNWSEVGGDAAEINVYTLSSSSDIRKSFNTQFLGLSAAGEQVDTDDSITTAESTVDSMISALKDDAVGIGYMPLSSVPADSLKALSVEGIAASSAAITGGSYTYVLNYYILTRNPKQEASDFMQYITGSDVAAVLKGKGLAVK